MIYMKFSPLSFTGVPSEKNTRVEGPPIFETCFVPPLALFLVFWNLSVAEKKKTTVLSPDRYVWSTKIGAYLEAMNSRPKQRCTRSHDNMRHLNNEKGQGNEEATSRPQDARTHTHFEHNFC